MEQRISLITLAVADVARARAFYEALGWTGARQPDAEIVFFQAGPLVLALWDRTRAAPAYGHPAGAGGGIALAHNVRSPAAVDALLRDACAAGAQLTVAAARAEWGGYSGVFTDLDGHAWEVAHNPHWPLAPDGAVELR